MLDQLTETGVTPVGFDEITDPNDTVEMVEGTIPGGVDAAPELGDGGDDDGDGQDDGTPEPAPEWTWLDDAKGVQALLDAPGRASDMVPEHYSVTPHGEVSNRELFGQLRRIEVLLRPLLDLAVMIVAAEIEEENESVPAPAPAPARVPAAGDCPVCGAECLTDESGRINPHTMTMGAGPCNGTGRYPHPRVRFP